MQGVPIALARRELLGPRDQIGVIGFDGEARIVCTWTGVLLRSIGMGKRSGMARDEAE